MRRESRGGEGPGLDKPPRVGARWLFHSGYEAWSCGFVRIAPWVQGDVAMTTGLRVADLSEVARAGAPTMIGRQPLLLPPLTGEALTAWERLARIRGPGERRAALLAMLLTPASSRERQAWNEEMAGVPTAVLVHTQVQLLPPEARQPVLERLLDIAADVSLAERQGLLRSARRIMCADGRVAPLDRLRWLMMRHRLSGHTSLHRGGLRESNDLAGLPLAMRLAVARFTAYLARLVPEPAETGLVGAPGAAWYHDVVTVLWGTAPDPPPCQPPDVDGLGRSLQTLAELAWMRRPLLARTWTDAALPFWQRRGSRTDRLVGAEALRMACALLDTPVPPMLGRLFVEPPLAMHTVAA